MASRTLPGLGLEGFWNLGDPYKTGMDTNLQRLSTLVQAGAISKDTALPGSPSAGDIYIVPSAAGSNANDIAIFDGTAGSEAWVYITPAVGWRVYVADLGYDVRFTDTGWVQVAEGGTGGGDMTGAEIVAAIDAELGSADWQGGSSGGGTSYTDERTYVAGTGTFQAGQNFTLKGNHFTVSETRAIQSIDLLVGDSQTVRAHICSFDPATDTIIALLGTSDSHVVGGADAVITFTFETPVQVDAGTTYVLLIEGQVVVASELLFNHTIGAAGTDPGGFFTFGDYYWANVTPADGAALTLSTTLYTVAATITHSAITIGGGSGTPSASSLEDLTDVAFDHAALTDDDIGRPFGLVSRNPTVVGLLAPLTARPVSGGIEQIAFVDFSADPGASLAIPEAHRYDEIRLIGRGLTGGSSARLLILPDGVNPASFDIQRASVFATGSTPDVGTVPSAATDDFFLSGASSGALNLHAVIRGTKSGLPLTMDLRSWVQTPENFHDEVAVAHDTVEVQALSFAALSGSFTAGILYAIGVQYSAQPLPAQFDYTGSPGGAAVLGRFVVPVPARIRSGAQGHFKVGSNPAVETVLDISLGGVFLGTVTIPTTGDPVVSISTQTDIAAGAVLTIEADGASDFVDLYGSLILEGRG